MGRLIRVKDLAADMVQFGKSSFLYNGTSKVTAIYGDNGHGSYLVQMLREDDPQHTINVEVVPGSTLLAVVRA